MAENKQKLYGLICWQPCKLRSLQGASSDFLFLSRLLKTKAGEDPGFEIIKEVPGNSGGMPRMNMGMMGGLGGMQGMFKDAGLGNMMGSMLGGQGLGALGNPNMMKCKYFNYCYTFRSS